MLEDFALLCIGFVLGLEVSTVIHRRRTPWDIETLGHQLDVWVGQVDSHTKFVGKELEAVNVIMFTHRGNRYEMILKKAPEDA